MVRPRDEAKERRILEATLEVVERHGLAGFSIEAVAKKAGIAIGTVYIYFANKEALLNALYLEAKKSFFQKVLEGATHGEPIRPAFERMCLAYLHYVAENRAALMFMHQFRNSPFLFEQTREESSRYSEPLIVLIERGKAEGLLKPDVPTPMMIAFVQGTLAELAAFVSFEPKKTHGHHYAQIARLAWDALKT